MESAISGHGFDPAGPDFCGEIECADSFAEKRGLFVLRFGQSDLNVAAQQGNGNAREARPGAEIEKSGGVLAKMARGKEAFAEVPADDLFRIADRREIGAGVPFEKEVEVDGEVRHECDRSVWKVGYKEVGDCGF